jgi:hypothetical protein
VDPDLGLDTLDLAVEGVAEELQLGIRRVGAQRRVVVPRLLDLDEGAARRQLAQLLVHDRRQVHDQLVVGAVVLVPQHPDQDLRAAGPELHRLVGHALRGLPHGRILERPACHRARHDGRLVGLLDLPQNVPGANGEVARPSGRQVSPPLDAAQPLEWVEDPGLAPDGEVEAGIAIGQDVEPGHRLLREDAGDGVEVLLAEERVAHGDLERAGLRFCVYQLGFGYEPVMVVGSTRSFVTVSMGEFAPNAPTSQAAPSRSNSTLDRS